MKYYFASDVHLGLSTHKDPAIAEKLFENWLTMVENELLQHPKESRGLFLLGDIFDFWFEYKDLVPWGFSGVISKLRDISDKGIEITYLKGNHDCWSRGYFKSLGINFIDEPSFITTLGNEKFFLSHGDYMQSKKNCILRLLYLFFNSKIAYNIFSFIIHPSIFMKFGKAWSNNSRKSKKIAYKFKGEEETIVKEIKKENVSDIDYYILGHLHSETIFKINEKSTLVILGQWIDGDIYYGVYDEMGIRLEKLNL